MKRRPDADVLAASSDAGAVVDRVEDELHGEATRYRHTLWAALAVGLMPFLLAALGWSGMYVLPVRIPWYPFERGVYGLPWLSLYEWIAYLLLAAFFAFGFALIAEGRASARRLSADYFRILDADTGTRDSLAYAVVSAGRQRTELVLRNSDVFEMYPPLLDAMMASAARAETGAE